jgi:hypothetical protein
LNRFKAHAEAKLTTTARLLAWHFASETRDRPNTYSESTRRLGTSLDLNEKTIRKAAAELVDKGLFERVDRTGTYAPTYRLLVACPLNCEHLLEHNTKRELATLETLPLPNTPALSGKKAPPYIEKREEEELGALELGFILEALEKLPSLDTDQLTLKGFLELNPVAIAKAALEITSHLDSPKRIKAYLSKTISNTPNNLLTYAEHHKATQEGSRRLQKAKADKTPASMAEGLTPETNWVRVSSYSSSIVEGYEPSFLTKNFLLKTAEKGKLTIREVFLAKALEEVIHKKAFPLMKPEVAKPEEGAIYFDLDHNGKIETKGHLENWLQGDLDFLYTAQEMKDLAQREQALSKWKQIWLEQHPNEDFNPNAFFMDSTTRTMLAGLPKPISESVKAERFLAALTKTAREFLANAKLGGDLPADTFSDYLNKNFTLENDFNEWLLFFPERETGSHYKNRKKAFPAYLEARRKFSAQDLRSLAGSYSNGLSKKEFAKHPDTFLNDLVADKTKAAY